MKTNCKGQTWGDPLGSPRKDRTRVFELDQRRSYRLSLIIIPRPPSLSWGNVVSSGITSGNPLANTKEERRNLATLALVYLGVGLDRDVSEKILWGTKKKLEIYSAKI